MARDHNQLTITGRLGGDPESRFTPSGSQVCNFSVAVGNDYTNKNGDKESKTMWIKCVAWNKQAEVYKQYLHKGSRVLISGQLNTDEQGNPRIWQGTDGTSHASFEMTVRELVFLDKANASGGSDNTSKMDTAPVVADDDELPF
jgi:single-strand DNA-binding protein